MRRSVSLPETRRRFAVCLIVALLFSGCVANPAASGPDQTGAVVVGLVEQPVGLDPHLHPGPVTETVARQIHDTLLFRHPDSRMLVPGLARVWSYSADGRVLTLQLREDVIFHDGTPFDAGAVVDNLARIMSSDNPQPHLDGLRRRYSHAEAIGDYQVRIVLLEPWSPLEDALSRPALAMAGPDALATWSVTRYQYHQVGSGPFALEDYVPGRHVRLRRNTAWAWGPEPGARWAGRSIDEIEIRFYDDEAARIEALRQGEVHLAFNLRPEALRELDNVAGLILDAHNVAGQPLQFLMNTDRYPTSLRALRQALIIGTNRSAIASEAGLRIAPVAWGPLAENTTFAYGAMRGLYSHDRELAQRLLAEAGFRDEDADGWLERDG